MAACAAVIAGCTAPPDPAPPRTPAPVVHAGAGLAGNDVSWPQCSAAEKGYGLPLPPDSARFAVVGLTQGLPFTTNPCLATQLNWAFTRSVPVHAYTVAAFPTAAELIRDKAAGPWSTATHDGQLSNAGFAQATAAVAVMARTGFLPDVVWIDVEPHKGQPWPDSTPTQQRENRLVLAGVMRGLHDAGLAYGLYSFTNGWAAITGSWKLPDVPVWATAGQDSAAKAQALCAKRGFSGGHVYLAQWYDDSRDYDVTCSPYAFAPLAIAKPPVVPPSLP